MGSYSELFVGDCNFSWKYHVTDCALILFVPDDYSSVPLAHYEEEEAEPKKQKEERPFEHSFATTCGAATKHLETLGISKKTIKAVFVEFFSANFEELGEILRERARSYLFEKYSEDTAERRADRFVRRLERQLPRLTVDEQFEHVWQQRACSGDRARYEQAMEEGLRRNRQDRESVEKIDPKEALASFSRRYLREFLKMDHCVFSEDDYFNESGVEAVDLWNLYQVVMPVLASDPSVPIELRFGEIIDFRPPMENAEVVAFLDEAMERLRGRAALMSRIFGSATFVSSIGPYVEAAPAERPQSAREKGDELERLVAEALSTDPGFQVKEKHRRGDEEIDLVIMNHQSDPFWVSLQSPLLIFECRNKRTRVEAKEVRDFEIKLENSGHLCRLGVMVSLGGFTRGSVEAARRSCREDHKILLATRGSLEEALYAGIGPKQWLQGLILEQF